MDEFVRLHQTGVHVHRFAIRPYEHWWNKRYRLFAAGVADAAAL